MTQPTAPTPPAQTPPPGGPPQGRAPRRASPLRSVLGFAFLNSLGTGAVQTGVFFLLQSAFGYGRLENYRFGLVLYGAYIGGALAAGPGLRRLARALPWLSTRAVLTGVLLIQAGASFLPRAVMRVGGLESPPEWTMWVVGVAFGIFTGAMWPIVESYLSGGRSGRRLNSATGQFNVLWSGAVLASFWLMAPLLETMPLDVITALGIVQIASALLLIEFVTLEEIPLVRREPSLMHIGDVRIGCPRKWNSGRFICHIGNGNVRFVQAEAYFPPCMVGVGTLVDDTLGVVHITRSCSACPWIRKTRDELRTGGF